MGTCKMTALASCAVRIMGFIYAPAVELAFDLLHVEGWSH